MANIGKTVKTQWATVSGLSSVGGPWAGIAPSGATYPYCVFKEQQSPKYKRYFDNTAEAEYEVEIEIRHTSESSLRTLQTTLHTGFDHSKPTMDSPAYCQGFLRLGDYMKVDEVDASAGTQTVYVAVTKYRIFVGNP